MVEVDAGRRQSYAAGGEESNPLNSIPLPIMAIIGSIYTLVLLGIMLVIPILQLAFGGAYRNECPINSNIPVYLIVNGACGIATIALTLVIVLGFVCIFKNESSKLSIAIGIVIFCIVLFIVLMSLFLFAWLIVGSVWVFSAASTVQHDNPLLNTYCNRTLYQFAFAILIITYAMPVLSCCCQCFSACCKKGNTSNANGSPKLNTRERF